ncbi:MAG TPA: hypothetical protein VN788_09515 [Verrucomicrobiae bacterium]|nr:hypothetical protein [Verrucomicrobiae bacterium]
MRTLLQLTAVAIILGFAGSSWGQQATGNSAQSQSPTATSTQSSTTPSSTAQDPLAEAARRARERRKEERKTPRVFTNDNIPTSGGISSVGQPATPRESASPKGTETRAPAATASSGNGEKFWRDKFASLRHKLQQDQENLALSQRELGTLNTQFYADPNKQLQQQLTRDDIDKKTAEIDKAKAQVDADQKAISDAEDDLRKSGGDMGWAR